MSKKEVSAEQLQEIVSGLVTDSIKKMVPLDMVDVKSALEDIEAVEIDLKKDISFEKLSKHNIPDRYKNIEVTEESFQKSARKVKEFFEEIKEKVFEVEHVIDSCVLALLTQEHLLLMGAPGNAKSMISDWVFARIIDEYTNKPSFFSFHITEVTLPDDLLGPINWGSLMKFGKLERDVTQGILGANYALMDEVFDGNPGTLRACFNALNERLYRQGDEEFEGILESVIQTTNKYVSELKEIGSQYGGYNSLDAYLDRLCFIAYMPEYFHSKSNYFDMMKHNLESRNLNKKHLLKKELTCGELDIVQRATELVKIPDNIVRFVIDLVLELNKSLQSLENSKNTPYYRTHYYSKRSFNKTINVLQACVVYDKIFNNPERELIAGLEDIEKLHYCLILNGPSIKEVDHLLENLMYSGDREKTQLKIVKREQEEFYRIFNEHKEGLINKENEERNKLSIDKLIEKHDEDETKKLLPDNIYEIIYDLTDRLKLSYYQKNRDDLQTLIEKYLFLYKVSSLKVLNFETVETNLENRINFLSSLKTLEYNLPYKDHLSVLSKDEKLKYIKATWQLLSQELEPEFGENKNLYTFESIIQNYETFSNYLKRLYNISDVVPEETLKKLNDLIKGNIKRYIENNCTFAITNFTRGLYSLTSISSLIAVFENNFIKSYKRVKKIIKKEKVDYYISKVLDTCMKDCIGSIIGEINEVSEFEKLFYFFEKNKLDLPKTSLACRKKINEIFKVIHDKNQEHISIQFSGHAANDHNYLNYRKYCQEYSKFIKSINLNEFKVLDHKLTITCKKLLKSDERYIVYLSYSSLDTFDIKILQEKIIFLKKWVEFLISFTNTEIASINSLQDLDSLTKKIKRTGFTKLMFRPEKEFFKLNQEIETLKKSFKSDKKLNTKLNSQSKELKEIRTSFNHLINKFNNISNKLISSGIYDS